MNFALSRDVLRKIRKHFQHLEITLQILSTHRQKPSIHRFFSRFLEILFSDLSNIPFSGVINICTMCLQAALL